MYRNLSLDLIDDTLIKLLICEILGLLAFQLVHQVLVVKHFVDTSNFVSLRQMLLILLQLLLILVFIVFLVLLKVVLDLGQPPLCN